MYLFVKFDHAVGLERWFKGAHFVKYATSRPDIASMIVRQFIPNFWRGIIGSSSLGLQKAVFVDLGNIHVAKFYDSFGCEKYVGALNVSVSYFYFVQSFKSMNKLAKNTPDFLFLKELAFLLLFVYLVLQISSFCEFHYYAEATAYFFKESFLVRDDVLIPSKSSGFTYSTEARILTSFKAFYLSFSLRLKSFTFFRA